MAGFEDVKKMVEALGLKPEKEDIQEEFVVVSDIENGINALIIDCEDPILVLEMKVMGFHEGVDPVRLLQMNRNMVHGAFVLDENGENILWRDTLQLENLDLNELQGSINALSLAMNENAAELITLAKGGN
ncbi:MAG: molecular chaperone Tir [Nitrospinota bacterium]